MTLFDAGIFAQENDELLKNELDRRSALLDEAVAVVRGSIPDIDAYTAAEVQINDSKVLAKQAAAAAQLATLYEARQVLIIADSEIFAVFQSDIKISVQIHYVCSTDCGCAVTRGF
ncbi:hypothetical protein HPB50_012891 [Hyalomma asiaticum]|uniref:Uncharacterized protein n=1 Tax=Hyalomma asiaticum TaxID=266040 RepID=A0ACB7S3D5_HYAAI|nr:hypothetical protein HPB50_012891 [Hyalomma asiaticum]